MRASYNTALTVAGCLPTCELGATQFEINSLIRGMAGQAHNPSSSRSRFLIMLFSALTRLVNPSRTAVIFIPIKGV